MNAELRPDVVFDVIVLGAGIAGYTSAIAAAELGRSVLVLEKEEFVGGSTAMSGGFFAFAGTDEQRAQNIGDDDVLLFDDLRNVGGHANDVELVQFYVDRQAAAYRWLRSLGISFSSVTISSGQSVARSHCTDPKRLLNRLEEVVRSGGLAQIHTGCRALELVRDHQGSVAGVTLDGANGRMTLHARGGVVLATGGFSRSPELLDIFAPEQAAAIPYGGLGNSGDGLRMAWLLGAGLRDMGAVTSTFGSHPDTTIAYHELLTAYYLGAIIVNTQGRRFVDESQSYKVLGDACLRQPDAIGYEIYDSVVRRNSKAGVPVSDLELPERRGRTITADTLEDLASKISVPPGPLVSTIDSYNAAVRNERVDEFGRAGLCNGVGDLIEISTPPFHAYPAKPLLSSTFGGLATTKDGQVVDVCGRPIAGLFAAGEVTGGFHGRAYMTGTSLGKGVIFGRAAGNAVARRCTP
jgi:fumarate reductase flavoprotein subunit